MQLRKLLREMAKSRGQAPGQKSVAYELNKSLDELVNEDQRMANHHHRKGYHGGQRHEGGG